MIKSIFKYSYLAILLALLSCTSKENVPDQDTENEIRTALLNGINYKNQLNFEDSYKELKKALTLSIKTGSKKYEVLTTLNMGLLYHTFSDTEKGLFYLYESLDLAKKYQEESAYNAIYNNIGIFYSENNNFIEAEYYFRKALEKSLEKGKPRGIAINYINIAITKEAQNQNDSAIFYNNKALLILDLNNINNHRSAIYNNIGNIEFKKEKYQAAIDSYSKALYFVGQDSIQTNIGEYNLNLGKSYVQANNLDSAKLHLDEALAILLLTNNAQLLSECYYWLYKNEVSTQANSLSKQYFDECLAWKDSSMTRKKEKWVSDVQMKYEFGKKQKEIEYLEVQSANQKKIILAIILSAILFIFFIITMWRSRNRRLEQKNLLLKKEKDFSDLEKERNELKRLKLEEEFENQKRISEYKEENARIELDLRNKEVTSRAVHLMNKNEILTEIYKKIELDFQNDEDLVKTLSEVKLLIKNNLSQDKAWEDFKLHFEQVHEGFVLKLKEKHPDLSPTDFRLCAYLLIDLSPKEIASISNISPDSVRKRKQRLREKLNISSSINIEDYLKTL